MTVVVILHYYILLNMKLLSTFLCFLEKTSINHNNKVDRRVETVFLDLQPFISGTILQIFVIEVFFCNDKI